MEDDKIKKLFDDFQPELSSSHVFMAKLQKGMEAVEIVKRHNLELKKRNRLAVAIAALSGLAIGLIVALILPLAGDWISTFDISIPRLRISSISIDYTFVSWIVMAFVSVVTALNAYEIALVKLASKARGGKFNRG